LALSDDVCTALQLTNHWQDVKRDILERHRLYIPRELIAPVCEPEAFERRLIASARQGWAIDPMFLEESRRIVRSGVERTWPLFERGSALLEHVDDRLRPVIGLFIAGGTHILRSIESWNFETALHRPRLGRAMKAWLVARAMLGRLRPRPRRSAAA
jgi:phytoene/squalene synthetase